MGSDAMRATAAAIARLALAALAAPGARADETLVPMGDQFLVNAYTTGFQRGARLFDAQDGSFRAVWQTTRIADAPGSNGFVVTRRLGANGVALTHERRVDVFDDLPERDLAAAAWADGGYVVAWGRDSEDPDECFFCDLQGDVFGRVFAAADEPVGAFFQVDESDVGWQDRPSVATFGDDGFVVTWTDHETSQILVRRYTAPDVAGAPFVAATSSWSRSDAMSSSVIPDGEGGLRVVWHELSCSIYCVGRINAARFTLDGQEIGAPFLVAEELAFDPDVKVAQSGDWVIAWPDVLLFVYGAQPTTVRARRYDPSGAFTELVAPCRERVYISEVAAELKKKRLPADSREVTLTLESVSPSI
ncbi:MAG: hypothetical protein KC586_16650, partial [Myxococcales bacterium]|nr:hypothetical protein [Myxococcales bacterium]